MHHPAEIVENVSDLDFFPKRLELGLVIFENFPFVVVDDLPSANVTL